MGDGCVCVHACVRMCSSLHVCIYVRVQQWFWVSEIENITLAIIQFECMYVRSMHPLPLSTLQAGCYMETLRDHLAITLFPSSYYPYSFHATIIK